MSEAKEALASKKHFVVESGTGTGKTICALVAALELAKGSGRKVIYLTRTVSQSDQVMVELQAISEIKRVVGIPMSGRAKSCLFMKGAGRDDALPPHALSRFCEEKKKRTRSGQVGGCGHYANLSAIKDGSLLTYVARELPLVQEFDDHCADMGICPYEARKLLAKDADVVVAPYIHVLSDELREHFMETIGSNLGEVIMIIDEAHNLVDSARDAESFRLTLTELHAGMPEFKMRSGMEVGKGTTLKDLVDTVKEIITDKIKEIPEDQDEVELGRMFLEGELATRLGLDIGSVKAIATNTFELGQAIAEEKIAAGSDPRSMTLHLGEFLRRWSSVDGTSFVKTASREEGGSLRAVNVVPEQLEGLLSSCPSVLHMSGTLRPLEQYVDVAGVPSGYVTRCYPSPYPPENKMVLYTPDLNPGFDAMARDPSMKCKVEEAVTALCNAVDVSTIVFFRSYDLMRRMRPQIEPSVHKGMFWDTGLSADHFNRAIYKFKQKRGGIFFTAMGGRVSEGLDFPGRQLEMVVIVGLPYSPPSLALRKLEMLYETRYGNGKGKRYAQEVPAIRKVNQAVGRLIRTESDRGAAIILDSRTSKYAAELDARPSAAPAVEVQRFFSRGDQHS
ncbi:MAG: ATP-dependent DNA helicase [Methanomassiliicoccales archaeon]|nr:MAG: ATP-dependent DNA helicase [Methanomassiliicoccales archaeon]